MLWSFAILYGRRCETARVVNGSEGGGRMVISQARTTFAQFSLYDGHETEQCPQLALGEVAPFSVDDRPRDQLYIICEPVELTPRATPLGATVMAAIRDAYAEGDREDPIAAIANAVNAANDVLYAKNCANAPNLRVFLGVTCLVVRDRELIICQVPPTQALIAQDGAPIALPELESWHGDYQPHDARAATAPGLGMHAEVTPLLFRATLEAGDLLILCSSNLACRLDPDHLGPLVGDDPVAARDFLHDLARRERLDLAYAAAIAPPLSEESPFGVDRAGEARQEPALDDVEERAGLGLTTGWIERGLREMRERARVIPWPRRQEPAPRRVVPLHDGVMLDRDGNDPMPLEAAPSSDALDAEHYTWTWSAPVTRDSDDRLIHHGRGTASRRWHEADSATEHADDEARFPTAARAGRHASDAHPLLIGVGAVAALVAGTFFKAGQPASRQGRRHETARPERVLPLGSLERWNRRRGWRANRWTPLLIASALAVLALVLVYAVRSHQATVAEDRFSAQLATITTGREAAVALADHQAGHAQLLALRDKLAAIPVNGHPQWQNRVTAERDALARALDQVDGVERVGAAQIELLAKGPAPASTATSRPQIILGDGQQFVLLDGMLYAVDGRAKTFTKLLAKGDSVSGVSVGPLLGIVWRIDKLFAFDEQHGYLRDSTVPGGWTVVPLAATGLKPLAVDSFDGNLYFLAADRGQILKFSSGSYDATPQPWSSPKANGDLTQAIDLSIDKDIYALLADGRVLDFYQGEQKSAYAPTIVPPLAGASALHVTQGGKYLYLVDPREGRIIRLSRDGNVLGIYKAAPGAPSFVSARELAVDEVANVAYLLTDDGLLAVHLPNP